MPPVASLNCAEADRVLNTIARTNYRAIGPNRPKDPRDSALFDYENAVAKRMARRCGAPPRPQSFGSGGGNRLWKLIE
ncbi:MAG: hypothetical protein AAF909_02355 [Pseudomonadota bacterium]